MNEKDLQIILGRLNGLHASVLTIARALPPAVASEAAQKLQVASERVNADALASPIAEATVNEMERVMREFVFVLKAAAQDH